MKKDISKFKKSGVGFTLIEVMVSVAIFSLLIAGPTGFFISSLKAQKKALSSQELVDTASYFLEYASRAIRMAQKEKNMGSPNVCLTVSGNGANYEITEGPGIKFINYKGECQKIYLEVIENINSRRLKEWRRDLNGVEKTGYLTSVNLEVVDFKIKLSGGVQSDNLQPKVTIFLNMRGKSQVEEMRPEINIQTTISQRNLDVEQ